MDDKDQSKGTNDTQKDHNESPKFRGVSDVIKRLFAVGSSAAFLTEEGIKAALGDIKLPKELLKPLLESAMSSKQQILNRVSQEVADEMIKMINSTDFQKDVLKFLETHRFKMSIEIDKRPLMKKEAKHKEK